MEYAVDNSKRYLKYVVLFILFVLAVVVFLGRIEFHNELERNVLPHTFLGYLDETYYSDSVEITKGAWPEWTDSFDKVEQETIHFSDELEGGYIGIYADLIYYENRYEMRTWLSGRLLEQAAEYYYKPEGPLYLEAIYTKKELAPDIEQSQIVPQQYNYMAFQGK